MSDSGLEAESFEILSDVGGLTARELARLVSRDKGSVNSVLYQSALFVHTDDLRPLCVVSPDGTDEFEPEVEDDGNDSTPVLELRR